jgi:DMSO/TMAO reductase YedYZ molybdopterin-dependent catalytic subunit
MRALPAEAVTTDIHCVTRWSKLGTRWFGVSLDTLMAEVDTSADFALALSYGGYTTNLPLEDLLDGRAWLAYRYEDEDLPAEHGGPARLLVPHLYFWKSAKWVRGIRLLNEDEPGFWETLGYHDYGDPWREQRYQGD